MRLLIALLVIAFTASPLSAQIDKFEFERTLDTKYCGSFKLSLFQCSDFDPPEDNFIDEVCYDAKRDLMLLALNKKGDVYCHCGLGVAKVNEFLHSLEMGRFYNYQIKGRFHCPGIDRRFPKQ